MSREPYVPEFNEDMELEPTSLEELGDELYLELEDEESLEDFYMEPEQPLEFK